MSSRQRHYMPGQKRVYRKVMEGNLRKEDMAPETKERLKEAFREDVARLEEYTEASHPEVLDGFSVRCPDCW